MAYPPDPHNMKPRPTTRSTKARPLTEHEQYGQPFYSYELAATVKVRHRCQARPRGRCGSNATMLVGRRKLCATHVRMLQRGEDV